MNSLIQSFIRLSIVSCFLNTVAISTWRWGLRVNGCPSACPQGAHSLEETVRQTVSTAQPVKVCDGLSMAGGGAWVPRKD